MKLRNPLLYYRRMASSSTEIAQKLPLFDNINLQNEVVLADGDKTCIETKEHFLRYNIKPNGNTRDITMDLNIKRRKVVEKPPYEEENDKLNKWGNLKRIGNIRNKNRGNEKKGNISRPE